MSSSILSRESWPRSSSPRGRARRLADGSGLGRGVAMAYLSIVALIPLAAVVFKSLENGTDGFWSAATNPQAGAALRLTLIASLIVVVVNAVFGTLIAWVLVRDEFPGRGIVNSLIDLPFALPTIVAGLTLLALWGPKGPLGVDLAFSRLAVVLALLFVTLPFVVRAVQPVLLELDGEMEQAAESLGATPPTIFRRVVLPVLMPAILAGSGLGFARAVGEFGSLVLLTGNVPFETQAASVFIFSQVESDNITGAAAVSVVLLLISFLVLLAIGRLANRVLR